MFTAAKYVPLLTNLWERTVMFSQLLFLTISIAIVYITYHCFDVTCIFEYVTIVWFVSDATYDTETCTYARITA